MDKTFNTTLVSVIMPTYNRENCISDSIQSVINQTFQDWELLIVDDRSTDRTKDIVVKYSQKDPRIKYLKNENTKGPAGAKNYGIAHSSAKYLSFLDSDDLWLTHHLMDSIAILEKENLPFCSAKWYEKRGNFQTPSTFVGGIDFLINSFPSKQRDSGCFVFDPWISELILERNIYPFHTSTSIIRKNILQTIGQFDEHLFCGEDSDLFFRITLRYGICIIDNFHAIWVEGNDNIHFFKEDRLNFEKHTLPKINLNRISHIKLFKKQIKIIVSNRNIIFNYKRHVRSKAYEIIYNSLLIFRLNKKRNLFVSMRMILNVGQYFLLSPGAITFALARNREQRAYLENLYRTGSLSLIQKVLHDESLLMHQITTKRKNFWLYLENDISYKLENGALLLCNYKTKENILFKQAHSVFDFMGDDYFLFNYSKLKNKLFFNFVRTLEKRNFGGIVDVTDINFPVSIYSKSENSCKWL